MGGGLPDEHCDTEGKRVHCKDLVEARMNLAAPECTAKCRSREHAEDVVAAVTRGSEGQLRLFLSSHCHNAATLRDHFGRTTLHMAASMGKKGLLEWLLEMKNSDLTVKDKESGWTVLHRSAFYGQIHCLISLIKVCFWVGGGSKHPLMVQCIIILFPHSMAASCPPSTRRASLS